MSYESKPDDLARSANAIAVSLSPDVNGSTNVVIDDICSQHRVGASHAWDHAQLYTTVSFPTGDLEALRLDKEAMAKLGENIIVRLLASTGRGPK